jgi:WD40 repeat protein
MKRLSQISIFFFLLLAIGCNSQIETPTSLHVTATIENTETPKPSYTPTTSPSPTPEQITIEFPEWVKNPETQILLVPVGTMENGYENMALFNAETGERFIIPVQLHTGSYFWMTDGLSFGYLPFESDRFTLFSIDGGVTHYLIKDYMIEFAYMNSFRVPDPIQVSGENIDSSSFKFIDSNTELSPSGRFFIYKEDVECQYPQERICIFDTTLDEVFYISYPNDDYNYLSLEWSPNSQFLAIIEVDEEAGNYFVFQNKPDFRLRVYDVDSHQIVVSYNGVTFPTWSPDGTKFLFQEWRRENDGFFWYGNSPPCIFDTITGETKCYEAAGQIAGLDWSPDQTMMSYIENGRFCFINLSTDTKNCILENLEGIPRWYTWSPDSNFISFVYDTSCVYCDYIDDPQLGIANVKTGEYHSMGYNVAVIDVGLWRPSINR